MSLLDSSASLLAICGGDTVKLFDVSAKSGDPCTLSYCPSPGCQVNSVEWNHTNLVVASAGEDKKISLWHKNGRSFGIIPPSGSSVGDDLEESILSLSFSHKSSRYLCSGGSGCVVRIWDLQKNRCIKWLSGHTDTITGVMYNCKDEHLASISTKGDLILHNLASGARAADLKDPFGQVLRVLDYSRLSRHILAIAGDDGSIHLWDTTGRAPKVSWLMQHSAPTTGVCLSPSSDKIIASVGLDKKLYTFDSGMRRPTSCVSYDAPFSSLAYSDDASILAAGTNGGLVVFYDVRGKPQPFTVLHAFSSSEAITSLCWQRSKPFIVNESNCTAETALLGGVSEDPVLMPDPRPSMAASSFSSAMAVSTSRSSLITSTSGPMSTTSNLSIAEETPLRSSLWRGGSLSKLQAPQGNLNLKDDMDVFSPLVDVQPITPSLGSYWDDHDDEKKGSARLDKKSLGSAISTRRFPFADGDSDPHPISDWRSSTALKQDNNISSVMTATPVASSKSESSFSPTPPEAWGGNALADKSCYSRQPPSTCLLPSGSLATGSTFAGLQDFSSSTNQTAKTSLTKSTLSSLNQRSKSIANIDKSSVYSESSSLYQSTSVSTSFGIKPSSDNFELPGSVQSLLPKRYTTYAERLSTASTLSDGTNLAISSPKSKKTGAETREELLSSLLSKQDPSATAGNARLPAINGMAAQSVKASFQPADQLGSSSFSLQLVQRTVEETLGFLQKSIHDDVKNLHIDLLRQFHMQEMLMSNLLNSVLEKQDELIKEVQSLRRENQQLRQLL